ncbi:MAG: phytanoyl-CoA dioxygenase family protein [Bacteroidetes bacterium]|nr:phytanoyl-CoA dioxygenase family protein [Bacteroidota bacterium]
MKVLIDEINDNTLRELGYITIPFLNSDELRELNHKYSIFHPKEMEGLYASAHHQDFNFRIKMSTLIRGIIESKFKEISDSYRLLGSSFLAKSKKGNGLLSPHQDWNLVDESEFTSYNLWVPLVDVNSKNGTIQIIKGSHLWHSTLRGPNIKSAYHKIEKKLMPLFTPIEISAGIALIYDHRLIHYSDNNQTPENRLVTVSGLSPKIATNYYYFASGKYVNQYYLEDDFYLRNNIFEGNKTLKLKQKIEYSFPQYDCK